MIKTRASRPADTMAFCKFAPRSPFSQLLCHHLQVPQLLTSDSFSLPTASHFRQLLTSDSFSLPTSMSAPFIYPLMPPNSVILRLIRRGDAENHTRNQKPSGPPYCTDRELLQMRYARALAWLDTNELDEMITKRIMERPQGWAWLWKEVLGETGEGRSGTGERWERGTRRRA
jgi:hypothetical protein